MSTAAEEKPTPLLQLDRVSLAFTSQRVLAGINLSIPRGQTIVIIGESGCGKTVLLKLLIGLLRPTEGNVILDGKNLAGLDEHTLTEQRLRFGFLFQGAALFDSMTVFDNVAFGLRHQRKLDENRIRERVHQRLQEVGLKSEIDNKKPVELSEIGRAHV